MRRYISTLILVHFLLMIPFCPNTFPGERFIDNNDGTITDHQLGLMWAQTDNIGDIDWHQANKWVHFTFPYSLPILYENWRLPTLEELQSLYIKNKEYNGYEAECGQLLKIIPEIHLTCGFVWSSNRQAITAQVFNFKRGIYYSDRMVHRRGYRAIAVRELK